MQRFFSMSSASCIQGLLQTKFIPALVGVLFFSELAFYLYKLSVLSFGNCCSYSFTAGYWGSIEIIIPIVFTIFFGMLIQRDGGVSNMFPEVDPLLTSAGGGGGGPHPNPTLSLP